LRHGYLATIARSGAEAISTSWYKLDGRRL
jgi:hypothetical protein